MKKTLSIILALIMTFTLVACASEEGKTGNTDNSGNNATSTVSGEIHVVSREDGSGTRGAFVEIVGVVDENDNDLTVQTATFSDGTGKVVEIVSTDERAIGYASLGSVVDNPSVKTLKVNGVAPTAETIIAGEYSIQRPLNIAYKESELSELGKDFVAFAMSKEGQDIAVKSGFVQSKTDATAYEAKEVSGELNISGSTSVGPLVKKLAEAYEALHQGVKIVVTENGSSAGMKDAIAGIAEIGMASRDLKEEEKKELQHLAIAIDGIAMIVAPSNPTEDIKLESIKSIYTGEVTTWEEVK